MSQESADLNLFSMRPRVVLRSSLLCGPGGSCFLSSRRRSFCTPRHHLLHMSVGQLARSFQEEAPVLYIQQNPDYQDSQMTRIPLIFSIGSIFARPSLDHVVRVSPSRRS